MQVVVIVTSILLTHMYDNVVQQLKSQHLPIAVYGVKANKACYLVQDGYITLYSYDRKIPFFTAEKLERNIVKNVIHCNRVDGSIILYYY